MQSTWACSCAIDLCMSHLLLMPGHACGGLCKGAAGSLAGRQVPRLARSRPALLGFGCHAKANGQSAQSEVAGTTQSCQYSLCIVLQHARSSTEPRFCSVQRQTMTARAVMRMPAHLDAMARPWVVTRSTKAAVTAVASSAAAKTAKQRRLQRPGVMDPATAAML